MALKRLAAECRACPFIETCDHKRMEALAYYPDPCIAPIVQPNASDLAAPVLRETIERHAYGQTFVMYKDDLEKELYKSLRIGLNLMEG